MERRAAAAALLIVLVLGCLALWVGIPAGWLWVTKDLDAKGARFIIVIAGSIASMFGAAYFLRRLEDAYVRAGRAPGEERSGVLDSLLVVSAVVAIVALVIWWALIADNPNPSGPLQPL
jgi:hypothetical protein